MTPEDCCKSGSEFGEQTALFCWLNSRDARDRLPPEFYNAETRKPKMYANYNNAGNDGDKKTAAIRGARAKQSGSQKGVADIFLPLARKGCFGLYLELKIDPTHPENQRTGKRGDAIKAKAGTVSEEQLAFGRQVQADGFGWAVCEGWKAARDVILAYMAPE